MSNIEDYFAQTLSHVSDVFMKSIHEQRWFEENKPILGKELLKKGHVNPKKVFIIIDAIKYRTEEEHVSTDRKKKFEDVELDIAESIPRTGFVKQKIQFTESTFTFDDYEKMLVKFDLKSDTTVPLETYTQIESFKNALETQFNRQASEIVKLHQRIAEEFGTLYSHAEQAMLDEQQKKHPKDFKNKLPEGWSDLTLNLHSIFNRIQYGMSPEKIKRLKVLDSLFQNKYIDQDLAGETAENIMGLCRRREPIIDKLRVLTKKILPLESITEDYLLDQEIKSIQNIHEKEAFKDMPDPASFAQKRADRNKDKDGSNVSAMTAAIKLLRSYLVEKKLNDLDRKVNGIATHLIENTEGLAKSQRTTVSEWIKSYFEAHQSMKKNRLNNS